MSLYDILKDAASVAKEAGKIEQYKQILEVQEKLLEMQKQIADLENLNSELKQKISAREAVKYDKNSYWKTDKDGLDGPFCSHCFDADSKLIRIHPCGNPSHYVCPACKTIVEVYPEKNPPQRNANSYYNFDM